MTAARLAIISAALGCLLVILQIGYHLTWMVDFSEVGRGLHVQLLVEVLVGAAVMALPAMAILYFRMFKPWVAATTPVYPLFLAGGFWTANGLNDGLAYMLWFLTIMMPMTAAYALLLCIGGWMWRSRTQEN